MVSKVSKSWKESAVVPTSIHEIVMNPDYYSYRHTKKHSVL